MKPYEKKYQIKNTKLLKKSSSNFSNNGENILCNHCKRTSKNGIRCLGMCVADNDY